MKREGDWCSIDCGECSFWLPMMGLPADGRIMKTRAICEARQMALDEPYRLTQVEDSVAIDESFPEEFADELSRRCGSTF